MYQRGKKITKYIMIIIIVGKKVKKKKKNPQKWLKTS